MNYRGFVWAWIRAIALLAPTAWVLFEIRAKYVIETKALSWSAYGLVLLSVLGLATAIAGRGIWKEIAKLNAAKARKATESETT